MLAINVEKWTCSKLAVWENSQKLLGGFETASKRVWTMNEANDGTVTDTYCSRIAALESFF